MEGNAFLQSRTDDEKLKELIEKKGSSLKWAKKLDYRSMEYSVVEEHVYKKGLPLVISNTTRPWQRDRELFSWDWLRKNFGSTSIQPRDVNSFADLPSWRLSDFVDYLNKPKEEQSRTLYGKDVPCPPQWREFLSQKLTDFCSKGSNDLMGELMTELQAETLMIYIGGDRTNTPGHLDIVGALGHNLMVYSDEGAYALWMCVGTKDREKASDFWHKHSGGSLYEDNRWLSVDTLAKAPFPVYVIEQREGDFVLLPSESAHQVMNHQGRSLKVSWNTLHWQSIEHVYFSALPLFRQLGKKEVYRVKATAYYALLNRLHSAEQPRASDSLVDELPPLLSIVEDMWWSEWIDTDQPHELDILRFANDGFPHQRTCDFCKCDIWNRCYHCHLCGTNSDGYDICVDCVAEGRGCLHKSSLELREYLSANSVKAEVERAQEVYARLLRNARKRRKQRRQTLVEWSGPPTRSHRSPATIAHLVMREYHKPPRECHQCLKISEPSQLVISITCSCERTFCAKCLWHRYALSVKNVLSERKWRCPVCRGDCNCGACLTARKVTDFSLESTLGDALTVDYPFQLWQSPNVPAVSDSKPHLHIHALKKRKLYLPVETSSPPPPAKVTPKELSKMTERQQIKFLTKSRMGGKRASPSPPSSPSPPLSPKSSDSPPSKYRSSNLSQVKDEDKDEDEEMSEASETNSEEKETSKHSTTKFGWKQKVKQELEQQNSWQRPPEPSPLSHTPSEFNQRVKKEPFVPTGTSFASQEKTNGESFNGQFSNVSPRGSSQEGSPSSSELRATENSHRYSNESSAPFRNHNEGSTPLRDHNESSAPIRDHRSTLLVRNLSYTCNSRDLEDFFRPCGTVAEVTLPMDRESGNHRGFGFVRFARREDAEVAMRDCHLRVLRDRVIELEWSVDRAQQLAPVRGTICFTCNKEGHLARNCPQRDERKPLHQGYVCFKCGQSGHVALDCPQSRDAVTGLKTVTCFKCGQNGHMANNCDRKSKGCFICGLEGHIAVECPQRFDRRSGPPPLKQRRTRDSPRHAAYPHSQPSHAPSSHVPSSYPHHGRSSWEDPRTSEMDPPPQMSYPNYPSNFPPNYSYSYPREGEVPPGYYPMPPMMSYPPVHPSSMMPIMGGMGSSSSQIPPSHSISAPLQESPMSPDRSPNDSNEPRRKFKQYASKLVVTRLTPHYANGQFNSKEDFKQLSRKIVSKLMEKERGHGFVIERDTDSKIKKFAEEYYRQYQMLAADRRERNRSKVEQWLHSL